MASRDFIVIGTSSGGVDALKALVSHLPYDLPATIAIVLHVGANDSILPFLLGASGPLPAAHAEDGEMYVRGRIYVAPPDQHLTVEGSRFRLSRGAKENFARPAIDPLFRSAAVAMGFRVIGVILTGVLDDGAAGLEAIQACGGTTIVQDPADAFAGDMPLHASPFADNILPLDRIPHRLIELTTVSPDLSRTDDPRRRTAAERAAMEQLAWIGEATPPGELVRIARPSTLTCPECHGALWRVKDSRQLRYRCHTGHAYSAASLAQGRRDDVERSLREALRAVQEREMVSRALAEHFGERGDTAGQKREEETALRASTAARLLRSMLQEG